MIDLKQNDELLLMHIKCLCDLPLILGHSFFVIHSFSIFLFLGAPNVGIHRTNSWGSQLVSTINMTTAIIRRKSYTNSNFIQRVHSIDTRGEIEQEQRDKERGDV